MNTICDLSGKVAVVTGAGGGIGSATCELLAERGAKVVATDVNFSSAEQTAQNIISSGGQAIAIQHDVTSESDWQHVMDQTLNQFKKLDILVNNAGTIALGEVKDVSLKDWQKVINVNLDGVFLGVRSAINAMIDNEEMCSIVNISSAAGFIGDSHTASYSASKAGVRLLTKSVALECAQNNYNIRVNSVCPGNTDKQMGAFLDTEEQRSAFLAKAKKNYPLGRVGETSDIAKSILFLASDESSWITGIDFVIDGGLTAGVIAPPQPD